MDRRAFMAAPLPATALFGSNQATAAESTVNTGKSVTFEDGTLAGKTLTELLAEHRYWLFDDFLPFLDEHVIDHALGGFMCNRNRDGSAVTTNKQPGYDGRGVYIYSFLYNHFGRDKSYLDIAKKTAEFLLTTEPDGDSLWPSQYTKEGKPLKKFDRRIYNDAFVATGFQELAKATGDTVWWERAKRILFKCVRAYNRKDYCPDFASVSYYLNGEAPTMTGPRGLGEWMVLFRIAVQMLEFKPDSDVEAVKNRCIDTVFDHHYNPKFDLINELLEFDLSLPDNEISQLVYTGHVFQVMWMFMYEAVRTGDRALYEKSMRMFIRHVEVSVDDVYGGVFQCLQHVDNNVALLDKPLWAEEEPLVGLLSAIEHTGDRRAKELYSRHYSYVLDKFSLKPHGYRLWNLHADRKATFVPKYTRIGNFHHPRHLMLNILALERMGA